MRDALLGGFAQSRILDLHGRRMLDGAFDPGFRLRLHCKDLAMRCNSAVRSTPRCSPPRRWRSSWTGCSLRAAGDRDHSALATLYEQLAGLTENAGVA